ARGGARRGLLADDHSRRRSRVARHRRDAERRLLRAPSPRAARADARGARRRRSADRARRARPYPSRDSERSDRDDRGRGTQPSQQPRHGGPGDQNRGRLSCLTIRVIDTGRGRRPMKRTFAALLVGMLALASCAGAGAPPTATQVLVSGSATPQPNRAKVVVSYSNVLADFFPAYVAKEAGIFDQNFLDVDLQLIASTTGLPALLAGQTQIAHIGGSEALTTTAGGGDVVVVANTGPVWPYQLYVAADIKTPADLKGKKVAIAGVGGTFDIGIRTMLRKLGIVPDTDVTVFSTGSTANATAALLSGNVAGTLSSPPDTLKLEAAGFHSLAKMADLNLP